jgi:hypothetical protein
MIPSVSLFVSNMPTNTGVLTLRRRLAPAVRPLYIYD